MCDGASVSRAGLLRWVAGGLGSVTAAGAAAAGFASASSANSLSATDRQILRLALQIERLQAAFYSEALRVGKLSGEAHEFAATVSKQEQAHVSFVLQALGSGLPKTSRFDFGQAVKRDSSFIALAVTLEDIGLAAYNGQAENLSRATLAKVARIISVEARHAAWARGLAGKLPAPVPTDVPISATQAMHALKRYGGQP
jgi:rubrerythrin